MKRSAFGLLTFGACVFAVSTLTGGCNRENSDTTALATPAPPRLTLVETIYLPDDNDTLQPRSVSRQAIDSQLRSGNLAPGLQEILTAAPAYFPPGAKINSATVQEKQVAVDLNAAFATPDFWMKKGEKTTELAVYALVNSASQNGLPVLLTIEKKPLETLGEFDASDPIIPRQ